MSSRYNVKLALEHLSLDQDGFVCLHHNKVHVRVSDSLPYTPLCGDPDAKRYLLAAEDAYIHDSSKLCKECVEHPDFELIVLGGI